MWNTPSFVYYAYCFTKCSFSHECEVLFYFSLYERKHNIIIIYFQPSNTAAAAMIILYKLEWNKQNNYRLKTNTQTTRLGTYVHV